MLESVDDSLLVSTLFVTLGESEIVVGGSVVKKATVLCCIVEIILENVDDMSPVKVSPSVVETG